MTVPLNIELLECALPCGVYVASGEYRRWQHGLPGAPALPTFTLSDMWTENEILYGNIGPVSEGSEFGPIPEQVSQPVIEFDCEEEGTYYRTVETESTHYPEETSTVEGIVYTIGGALRLASESVYRFGKWTPGPQIYLGKNIYYASDTNIEKRAYTNGNPITVDPYAVRIMLYEVDDYGVIADNAFYIYVIPHDPLPYWNPYIDIPDYVSDYMGKLDDSDIEFLVYDTPFYVNTGDLEYHALLALYELGILFGIITESPTVLSWRTVPYNKLDTDGYKLADQTDRRSFIDAEFKDKVGYIVKELVNKVGW